MKRIFLTAGLIALAACTTPVRDDPASRDSCGASRYDALMGQPESAIEAISFNQPVRITRPRQFVAEDFDAKRLNFVLDGAGTVTAITCE